MEAYSEGGGVGCEEAVGRDTELVRDVERHVRPRVHDHRVDASRRDGAEQLAELLVVAPYQLEVSEEQVDVVGDGGRIVDSRERVEGGRRLGGCYTVDCGGEGDVVFMVASMSAITTL